MKIAAVLLLCLASLVVADDFTGKMFGVVGDSYLTVGDETVDTPANLKGPVTVTIQTDLDYEVQVCFSTEGPVAGESLEYACDPNLFASFTNSSGVDSYEAKFTRKSFSAFSNTKRMSKRFAEAVSADDDGSTFNLNFAPSTSYYVTFYSPEAPELQQISVSWTGAQCDEVDQVGPDCVPEPEDPFADGDSVEVSVEANSYLWVKPTIGANWGDVSWSMFQVDDSDGTQMEIYAGANFLPTADVNSPAYTSDDDDVTTLTILNPAGPVWYVALYNPDDAPHHVNVTQSFHNCESPMFGFNCSQNVNDITKLSMTNTTGVFEFDAPEDDEEDGGMDLFQIYNTHVLDNENFTVTHFRVSVAPQGNGDGLSLYARAGAVPTTSFYDFKASGDYVNQLILPILPKPDEDAASDFQSYEWIVGVQGDLDYAIWVGGNCANNCGVTDDADSDADGYCVCTGTDCSSGNLFKFPANGNDSFGRCTCTTSKYQNYDCTDSWNADSDSGFKAIYVILLSVGAAIILAVAIGVPVYCYLQNRKRNNYERV